MDHLNRHGNMSKQDLTMYGNQELSLVVLNTEYLYRALCRCDDAEDLERLCEGFLYTPEQFKELESDLEEELKERESEEEAWLS